MSHYHIALLWSAQFIILGAINIWPRCGRRYNLQHTITSLLHLPLLKRGSSNAFEIRAVGV